MTLVAPTLQGFFTERLGHHKQASPRTIATYRDAFRMLLSWMNDHHHIAPSDLQIEDLGTETILAFLDYLETDRHNSARSRNARLAAIRSFFRYAALRHPEHAELIQRVLAIPQKRFDKATISFLNQAEVDALLAAPDTATWEGRRDVGLIALAVQTGLRVSELIGRDCGDVNLGPGGYVICEGKGRKQRTTPLSKPTRAVLARWLRERDGQPTDPLFPAGTGRRVQRGAIERRIAKYRFLASQSCPSLKSKHPTPHVLRHTCAIKLLQNNVDSTVIALWLGMSRPKPCRFTSTPTWPSRSGHWHAPRRLARHRAGTGPRTHCSRSCKASDYAELLAKIPASSQPFRRVLGIIRSSA
jgi:site-specific recombinase XerD